LAEARAQFYDRAAVESWIVNDLRNARTNIAGAETEFAQFFSICETRRTQIARILRLLDNYSTATRNFNQHRKMLYVKNIFDMYRRSLAITLDTSRGDSCRAQANCDEYLVLAGFKFAQAWIVSQSPGSRWRNYQSGFLSDMRDAIRKGIWLSMDIPNQRIQMTGMRKLCCSFGAKEEWDQHVAGLMSNSPPQTFSNVLARILDTVRRANLNGTPCQSEEQMQRGTFIAGCKLSVTGTNGTDANICFCFRGRTEIYFTANGRFRGESGRWELNSQTNVLSFWGTSHGRFSGPVSHRDNGFKIVGTWSNGTRETLDFVCIRGVPD